MHSRALVKLCALLFVVAMLSFGAFAQPAFADEAQRESQDPSSVGVVEMAPVVQPEQQIVSAEPIQSTNTSGQKMLASEIQTSSSGGSPSDSNAASVPNGQSKPNDDTVSGTSAEADSDKSSTAEHLGALDQKEQTAASNEAVSVDGELSKDGKDASSKEGSESKDDSKAEGESDENGDKDDNDDDPNSDENNANTNEDKETTDT